MPSMEDSPVPFVSSLADVFANNPVLNPPDPPPYQDDRVSDLSWRYEPPPDPPPPPPPPPDPVDVARAAAGTGVQEF